MNLKLEVNDLQQHTRKNNLIISGIPMTKGENVHALLNDVARVLQIESSLPNVSAAHRLPSRVKGRGPPSIVVNFVSRATKTVWLNARKQRRMLSAAELSGNFHDQTIYFNEHLTPETMAILNMARALKKDNKLAFAWTDEGRVLVKITATDYPKRIRQLDDLRELTVPHIPASSAAPEPVSNVAREVASNTDQDAVPKTSSNPVSRAGRNNSSNITPSNASKVQAPTHLSSPTPANQDKNASRKTK